MHINPYGAEPVALAVALVNERPETLDALVEICREHELTIDMPLVPTDLADTRAYLERWCGLVDATQPEARVAALNGLLAAHVSHPRVTDHAGDGWHLHYRDDHQSLAGVLATLLSMGTALHLVGRGMDRLGRCASEDCEGVWADTSKAGRQRYCSTRCSSREAVRRHRARQV